MDIISPSTLKFTASGSASATGGDRPDICHVTIPVDGYYIIQWQVTSGSLSYWCEAIKTSDGLSCASPTPGDHSVFSTGSKFSAAGYFIKNTTVFMKTGFSFGSAGSFNWTARLILLG